MKRLFALFCLTSALPAAYAQEDPDPSALAAQHWAFHPVETPGLPQPVPASAGNALDAHHQALLATQNLPATSQASRHVLARRLAFHLHGLPPEFADVETFLHDPSPDARNRHLDRLLASPRYGERWARHWMDVARYADNKGYVFEEERRYPYAYTFRDWLIHAFNTDLPFDQFLTQQLAGDHVAKDTGDHGAYAAMGYLTLGRRFLNREPDIIDDRIDVVTRGMLGLTVSCARCHDHKFDPIPTTDYYALYGVFASSYEPDEKPLLDAPDHDGPAYQRFQEELQRRQSEIDTFFRVRHEKLRSQPVLQAYFILAHEGRDWEEADLASRAQRQDLYQRIAVQWRDWIVRRSQENDPVFLPWKSLAELPQPFPPEDRASVLEAIRESSHPLIWEALRDAGASTMEEVIAVYAGQIAQADQENPHEDPHRESLRQILVHNDSPTSLDPEKLYRLLNTPEQQEVRRLRRELEKHQALSPGAPPRGMVLLDRDNPVEPRVFVRGNPALPGDPVPRRFLTALAGEDAQPFQQGSGRLELARAIASKENPLTARVFVNRVWLHLFGEPLVESPSDFGVRTPEPALAPLLDHLAADFMNHQWSVKRLQREILLSTLYGQDSVASDEVLQADPENRWLTRMRRQRLDFEAMRDSMLAVSHDLDLQMDGQPVDIIEPPFSHRRSVYGFIDRQNLPGTFRTFDMASPDAHTPQRQDTVVPQQALYMLNGPLAALQAKALGSQAREKATHTSEAEGVRHLYQRLLARQPDPEELALGSQFLQGWTSVDAPASAANSPFEGPSPEAWEAYAQALLASNEFLFID